jgi:hypothetical protein
VTKTRAIARQDCRTFRDRRRGDLRPWSAKPRPACMTLNGSWTMTWPDSKQMRRLSSPSTPFPTPASIFTEAEDYSAMPRTVRMGWKGA